MKWAIAIAAISIVIAAVIAALSIAGISRYDKDRMK